MCGLTSDIASQLRGLWHPIRGYLGVSGYDMNDRSVDLFDYDTLTFGPGDQTRFHVLNQAYNMNVTFAHEFAYYGDLRITVQGEAYMTEYNTTKVVKNDYMPNAIKGAGRSNRVATNLQPY